MVTDNPLVSFFWAKYYLGEQINGLATPNPVPPIFLSLARPSFLDKVSGHCQC